MTAAIQEERRAPATSDAAPVAAHADVAPADAAPAHAAAAPRWVMLARTGRWLGHPAAPEVITPEGLRSAADYFARHYAANGTDVVVDYHHASVASPAAGALAPAAGWVQRMELRAGGTELWGRVLWTAEAARRIARRAYRYLSPVLRFNAPDRVTGDPVPLHVHSVALTNTPFLTELKALNESASTDGRAIDTPAKGGESMSLLDSLAATLETGPEQVASRLGIDDRTDRAVAEAILTNAARLKELEAAPPINHAVAEALGLPPDACATQIHAAVIRLKAPGAGIDEIKSRLGLEPDAAPALVLNAIDALHVERARVRAEALVDEAVGDGRIPPAHRAFFLREAEADLEAAREVINSLPVLTAPAPRRAGPAAPAAGSLSDGQESVCRQLGLSAETFLSAVDR